jgi:hypothetical protein
MALKRINKELTDLGRYVTSSLCRQRRSLFCSHVRGGTNLDAAAQPGNTMMAGTFG